MAENDYVDHVGSDGTLPADRVSATGYVSQLVGENIAAGTLTPAETVNALMASGNHCRNIMRSNYTELGVGYVAWSASFYYQYWTEVFAAPN